MAWTWQNSITAELREAERKGRSVAVGGEQSAALTGIEMVRPSIFRFRRSRFDGGHGGRGRPPRSAYSEGLLTAPLPSKMQSCGSGDTS